MQPSIIIWLDADGEGRHQVYRPPRDDLCLGRCWATQILQSPDSFAVAASRAVERVGMPEAQIILAQAVTYVASAPK